MEYGMGVSFDNLKSRSIFLRNRSRAFFTSLTGIFFLTKMRHWDFIWSEGLPISWLRLDFNEQLTEAGMSHFRTTSNWGTSNPWVILNTALRELSLQPSPFRYSPTLRWINSLNTALRPMQIGGYKFFLSFKNLDWGALAGFGVWEIFWYTLDPT